MNKACTSSQCKGARSQMAAINASAFSADKVKFQVPKRLEQGGIVGITYEDAPLELKIPAARVPFDCGMGYQNKGKKVELKLEIPGTAVFNKTRDALKKIEEAARTHVRDNAGDICQAIRLTAARENDLRNGANFHGLLRPANDPKYPDLLTMKWVVPDPNKSDKEIPIVDIANNPIGWDVIKRDATVVAVIRIKSVFINSTMWTIQVEPVALCVTSTKKEVNTSTLFAEEMAQAAKRPRMSGPEEEEESEGA